jgi:hypothetical protein
MFARSQAMLALALALDAGAVGCGATEASPRAGGGGSDGSGGGLSASAGRTGGATAGGGSGDATITDGTERCTRLRASGIFAGAPLQGSDGWDSFGTSTAQTPWSGSYSWQGHALQLRGPADVAPADYVEGSSLTAAYGYMLSADAMPWKVACLAPGSGVRMVNANDVLKLEIATATTCQSQAGVDELDICVASPVYSGSAPTPPCTRGVTGTLDGKSAPPEPSSLVAASEETGATTLMFGNYVVRLPLDNWDLDSTTERDFNGGVLAVERDGAFDLYCAGAGHVGPRQVKLSGVSKLVSCDASARAVESAQVCIWDFTRDK